MRDAQHARQWATTVTSVTLSADLISGLPPATRADLLSDNRTSV